MREFIFFLFLLLMLPVVGAGWKVQEAQEVRLIVRGDDMGSSHAANVACLQSYKGGIMRTVELMVPGPWFPEAVKMLNENPGLDVGIHLVLTSEWENMKWRPLSCAPSLVDSDGYFFPMVWQNPNFPPDTSLEKSRWKLDQAEKELQAQIEAALQHVPRITHLGCHMGCTSLDPSLATLENKLAKQYHLDLDLEAAGVKHFPGWTGVRTAEERIHQFVRNLEALEPGTYLFVDHPGLNVPEMQALMHKGYEDVAADRDAVTQVFTSREVLAVIQKKRIRLVSYKDVKEGH
jgi:predicted glycoside hydrolase/deacetylase ChbG (UPF0249 family)